MTFKFGFKGLKGVSLSDETNVWIRVSASAIDRHDIMTWRLANAGWLSYWDAPERSQELEDTGMAGVTCPGGTEPGVDKILTGPQSLEFSFLESRFSTGWEKLNSPQLYLTHFGAPSCFPLHIVPIQCS